MTDNSTEKTAGPSKSFMTAGPALHYSHANVRRYWALAVIVYMASCFFWSKILTGTTLTVELGKAIAPSTASLARFIVNPLSIYEYPWQITVLGILMGIMAVCPVLISQLLSFRYSIVMILALVFIVKLPLFALFVLISSLAVACRPLRFRSRFISIALCMAPQLLYWAIFGGGQSGEDPIRWGFSFAPWISAWLTCLAIAGLVIGIGHFTRYKPGLVWSVNVVFLGIAVLLFQTQISFAELDYRLYIAGNNPEEVIEFHNHSLTDDLNEAIEDADTKSFFTRFFYSNEPILLREELKNEIQIQLGYDRWPNWFKVPPELNYQAKKQKLLNQYDLFISKRPTSDRMPVALYYKAMLNEYSPDIRLFGQTETLHFYSDYPHRETLPIWDKLYNEFPKSPEALEARWRITMHLAGKGEFKDAIERCDVAAIMVNKQLELSNRTQTTQENLFAAFTEPAQTVMTPFKLRDLQRKLRQLITLISMENHTDQKQSKARLAKFVILNPYARDYSERLDVLLKETKKDDPLRDNILLAKIMLIADSQLRADQLKILGAQFAKTDGGIQALYELGLLKVGLWKDSQTEEKDKDTYLSEARAILSRFIELYPKSIFREQAQTMLDSLPAAG